MLFKSSLVSVCGIVLSACATPAQPAQVSDRPVIESDGPLRLTLLGNYVGKLLRIEIDGQVLVDQRLTFPPAGAEHRYDLAWGGARTVRARVQIEGCDTIWTGEIQLEPSRSAYLLFEGCEVEALAPG